ncbi:nucleoside phosphatase family-domain-containing protein [Leucosporidium creatinivorum]|uniref:Nucleoside phosphatase family-domain-containing protein n=1 Tax=Leucosporidium creatinivorum TaxID=106004 RepID=A0A1Y2DDC4_9BASI|nr:nucleoside phosphatase family-domain-containing protein [Leucosporidium creatinivorum]
MPPRPPPWSQGRQYGIVIDAGSSGSRVQVYSWVNPEMAKQTRKANKESVDVLSKVEKGVEHGDGWHLKVEPGISTFGGRPKEVAEYLRPLIEFAASVVPAEELSNTPIYLLATAGMRLLPEAQQSDVLQATCDYLRTFPFSLPDCTENVRIITGEEEGLYGWIAVNYLMDGFDKHEHAVGGETNKHSSTYGFLDMGGASTQIAFEPSDREQIAHADNLLEVKLRLLSGKDVRHPVFVTTWLGFGTNQARNRYIDAQIKAHVRQSDEAHRPGDPDGLGSERPVVLVDDPCLPKSLMLSETRHSGYTLRGTGDFATCVRKTGPLLNKEVECLDQPCLFNGVHVPPIDFEVNHFIGISEYYYSTQDVWSMGGVYDFVEFEKNAIEYCGRQWDDIMAEHKKGGKWKSSVELSRLETQCFKAAWIINILHEGIGIPRIIDHEGEGDGKNLTDKALKKGVDKGLVAQKPSFQSLNEVGDVAVSWTLGKMVLEVSKGTMAAGGLPPDVDPSGKTRPASLDWSGHIPAWSGDMRSSISALKETDPIPLVGFSLVGAFLFFFFLSSSAARRRQACFGNVFTLSSANKRRGGDFLPLSQDDAASSSGDSSNGSGSRTPPRGGRRKGSTSTIFTRVLSPLRYGLFRVSSTVRTWTRPRSNSLLPTSRSTASVNQNEPDLIRPRPLRPSKSTPFLRSNLGPPAPHTNPTGGTGHWNDIPDLSEREKGVSLLPRSNSYNVLSTSSAPPTRTVSPPPMSIISSAPLSRPSSRGAGTPLGLSKLTSRTRESSSSDEPRRSNSSGTGSFFPEPSLTTGVWDSLGAGDAIDGATSPMAMMETRGGSSPGIISAMGESGAKLRASRSQNSSQVNLAANFAARRKDTSASSSSLAGGGED